MNLNSQSLDIVGSICTSSKISEVQLDLIPSLIQLQGHGANERFNSCDSLKQRGHRQILICSIQKSYKKTKFSSKKN